MAHSIVFRVAIGAALSALTATGALLPASPSYAQTDGMERRGEVRDTKQEGRDAGRDAKEECKDAGGKRIECRQEKREIKQESREEGRDEKRDGEP